MEVCAERPIPELLSGHRPPDPNWQTRYFGLNVWSRAKVEETLDSVHLNPAGPGSCNEQPTGRGVLPAGIWSIDLLV
ncbi:MAG: hypothetical protein Fues2KO_27400 [Fuerstiella sp.]